MTSSEGRVTLPGLVSSVCTEWGQSQSRVGAQGLHECSQPLLVVFARKGRRMLGHVATRPESLIPEPPNAWHFQPNGSRSLPAVSRSEKHLQGL